MLVRWLLGAAYAGVLTLGAAPSLAQSRNGSSDAMVRQALEDYQNGDAGGALDRLRLALRSCSRRHCSSADQAIIHIAIGTVAVAGQNDADTGANEFTTAHRLDDSARPDPTYANAAVMSVWSRATGGSAGATTNNSAPRGLGDPCDAARACGTGMHCVEGSCASGEGSPTASTTTTEESPAAGGESGSAPASAATEPGETWTVAFDLGGGLGAGLLSGSPEYSEYRVWDASNGMATCGPLNSDGSPTLSCPRIGTTGFGYEAILSFGVRVNFLRRVGFGLSVQFQPDSSHVGILPSLFFGGRLYVSLTSAGFVKRGLTVSSFFGTGVGQMQFTAPVAGTTPGGHVLSGLNNFHAGIRLEYGFGIFALGGEVSLNAQFPNTLFVIDAQAFASLHF